MIATSLANSKILPIQQPPDKQTGDAAPSGPVPSAPAASFAGMLDRLNDVRSRSAPIAAPSPEARRATQEVARLGTQQPMQPELQPLSGQAAQLSAQQMLQPATVPAEAAADGTQRPLLADSLGAERTKTDTQRAIDSRTVGRTRPTVQQRKLEDEPMSHPNLPPPDVAAIAAPDAAATDAADRPKLRTRTQSQDSGTEDEKAWAALLPQAAMVVPTPIALAVSVPVCAPVSAPVSAPASSTLPEPSFAPDFAPVSGPAAAADAAPAEGKTVPQVGTEPPVSSGDPVLSTDRAQARFADAVDAGTRQSEAAGKLGRALASQPDRGLTATEPARPAGGSGIETPESARPVSFDAMAPTGLPALRVKADGAGKGATDDRIAAAAAVVASNVPGRVTDAPTLAAALPSSLAATPGSPEFATQLGTAVSTFVRQGVQHARLELNPAEMGPLTVQIQLDGDRAQVHMAAEHGQTRQALEQSMPQLAGSLREAGLTLAGGGVFEQPPRQPPLPADWEERGRRERSDRLVGFDDGDITIGDAGIAQPVPLVPTAGRRGVVDLVA